MSNFATFRSFVFLHVTGIDSEHFVVCTCEPVSTSVKASRSDLLFSLSRGSATATCSGTYTGLVREVVTKIWFRIHQQAGGNKYVLNHC